MNTCTLCGETPWSLDLKRCDDCERLVCADCRAEHPHQSAEGGPTVLCEVCYEKPRREKRPRKRQED